MKLLSYNGRGLNKATAVRALGDVLKQYKPDVLFLMETHLDEWPAECLRRSLNMDYKEVVRSDGRKGGLLLLWKKEVLIYLRYKTDSYIDVDVGCGQDNIWRFTGFYGEPSWADKYKSWDQIRELHAITTMPWLIMGDLNEVLYPFEKEGGRNRLVQFMQAFRDVLADCGLEDLGYVGDKFTWHRGGIRERLDRGLANATWRDKFPDATLTNCDYSRSDHRPILLSFGESIEEQRSGPALLRFEARWLKEAGFNDVVQGAWDLSAHHVQNSSLAGRLAMVHDRLHRWDKFELKSSKRKLNTVRRELEEIARAELSHENIRKEMELA